MSEVIPGLKLIHRTGAVDLPDDPSIPWRLEVNFSPPEFMPVLFALTYGGTDLCVVRGETLEGIRRFVEINDFRTHPRFRRYAITGPGGFSETYPEQKSVSP